MRRLLIAGSRDLNPADDAFDSALATLFNGNAMTETLRVITGQAKGVDTAGDRWAINRGHLSELYPARWAEFGKRAGYIRNKQMVDTLGQGDMAIIFWDGKSKGTANTMKLLREANVNHLVVIAYE